MKWEQCKWCGKAFINYGTRQEYCSRKCNRKFNKLLDRLEIEKELGYELQQMPVYRETY